MSTAQTSEYVPVDILPLLLQLVKSQSDLADRGTLPNTLTSEHVKQLESLRLEYKALFASGYDYVETEHVSAIIARQSVWDFWNDSVPPILSLQEDGDAFAEMHTGPLPEDEDEAPIQDLIAAMREVNYRLVEFDHNKALLTNATRPRLNPENAARVTATRASFLDMFHKMRQGYK